jgi:lysophospholipase L1-like esterase
MKSVLWVALLSLVSFPAFSYTPATGDTRVCMVGGSITARGGWWRSYMADTRGTQWSYIGTQNANHWQDTYYWHDGVGGDTSGMVLERLPAIKNLNPFCQVVLLMVGGNDIMGGIPTETIINNTQTIADELAAAGAKVYIQTTLPVHVSGDAYWDEWNTKIVLFNRKLKSDIDLKIGKYDHTILDTWQAFVDATKGMNSTSLDYLYTDGIHLSRWGYWILAKFVRSAVP